MPLRIATTTITTTTITTTTTTTTTTPTTTHGCADGQYGALCQDTCGNCAKNLTCNITSGHCLACLDGWVPPLCNQESPVESKPVSVLIGVGVGAPISWAFIATVVQVWQVLGNAGWLPFVFFGKKEEEKEGNGEESENEESEDDECPICTRFIRCMFCGGCGICMLSCVFCITRGKLMSERFTWRKDNIDADDVEAEKSISDVIITEPLAEPQDPQVSIASIEDIPPQESDVHHKEFTDKYFASASWLADPFKTSSHTIADQYTLIHRHGSHNTGLDMNTEKNTKNYDTFKTDENVRYQPQDLSQANIDNVHQGSNTSLQQDGKQNERQDLFSKLQNVSEANRQISRSRHGFSSSQNISLHDRTDDHNRPVETIEARKGSIGKLVEDKTQVDPSQPKSNNSDDDSETTIPIHTV
ncbi:uncharacterized protein [Littorina saxatilis]|uniref:uncharacterized protein n=1 Tax=Littorina saxatilis TaxID=31220 RepID=UPI0038B67DBF